MSIVHGMGVFVSNCNIIYSIIQAPAPCVTSPQCEQGHGMMAAQHQCQWSPVSLGPAWCWQLTTGGCGHHPVSIRCKDNKTTTDNWRQLETTRCPHARGWASSLEDPRRPSWSRDASTQNLWLWWVYISAMNFRIYVRYVSKHVIAKIFALCTFDK